MEGKAGPAATLVLRLKGNPPLVRCGDAPAYQVGKRQGRERASEVVTLALIAVVALEQSQLFRRLHTFGDDTLLQAAAHCNDGVDDRRIMSGRREAAHKGSINF